MWNVCCLCSAFLLFDITICKQFFWVPEIMGSASWCLHKIFSLVNFIRLRVVLGAGRQLLGVETHRLLVDVEEYLPRCCIAGLCCTSQFFGSSSAKTSFTTSSSSDEGDRYYYCCSCATEDTENQRYTLSDRCVVLIPTAAFPMSATLPCCVSLFRVCVMAWIT
jgi:hypothetical protein